MRKAVIVEGICKLIGFWLAVKFVFAMAFQGLVLWSMPAKPWYRVTAVVYFALAIASAVGAILVWRWRRRRLRPRPFPPEAFESEA